MDTQMHALECTPVCTQTHMHARTHKGILFLSRPRGPMCTHTHGLSSHVFSSIGTVAMWEPLDAPGKARSVLWLVGDTRQERGWSLPFPSGIQIPTRPSPVPLLCFSLHGSISLSHHGLLLFALKGGRGGGTDTGAHSALRPALGRRPRCPAVFSLKQRRPTVAIDYGKIVCG